MKTNCKLLPGLAMAAVAVYLAGAAQAGIFTWSAATPVTTADATLGLTGTVVGAEVFGNDEKVVVLTDGTILDFKADGSVATATGNGTAYGAFTNDTGNAGFNAVLNQFNYDGGPKTITLNNLIVGQTYAVQLFALDRRDNIASTRVINFQDPNDALDITANYLQGDNLYVTATFTAGAASVDIQENLLNSSSGNINALVVRAIGTNIPPQLTSLPQSATVYHGLAAAFSVAALGTGPLSYQWQKSNVGGSVFTNLVNGGNVAGATNYSLALGGLTAADTADYRVVVSSLYGSVTSSPAATLTVLTGTPQFAWSAPIPIATADSTLNQSGTIVGAEVFGATETVVTLTNSSSVDFKADGSVASVSSGGFGFSTGAFSGDTGNANFNAVLNQFTFDGGPDIITLNNLFVGQQYSVQIFALDDRTYQQVGGDGSDPIRLANFQDPNDPFNISTTFAMGDNVYTIGTFIAGSTSVSFQENLPTGNNGNINAVVIRALGVLVAPQISAPPQAVTIDEGLTTSLGVSASGSAPLTYRWQKASVGGNVFANVSNGGRISGATSPTLTISNLSVADTGDYQVIVANAAGSVTSTPPATLTVESVTPQFVWSLPAAITTADAALNQSGTIVGAAAFGPAARIVVLTNGTSVDFKNDGSVASVTGAGTATGAFSGNTGNANLNAILNGFNYDNGPKTLTLTNLVAGQLYTVQLFALDDRGGSSARTANYQDPVDPYDYSATFNMGDNSYTLGTFTASGTTVNIQENLPIGNAGNLNALIVRRLSGLPLAPQITTQPQAAPVFAGATVQFTVGAIGTSLIYQWQQAVVGSGIFSNVANGGNVSGANTAQLTILNAEAGNVADYRVIVSNGSGSVTSSPPATLSIRPAATLAHRWSFNETSGTIAHDSIGAADGTLQGSASFNNGFVVLPNNPQSSANSYVTIPGGLVTGLSAVTFEIWYTNAGLNNGNTLIGFGGPTNSAGVGTNFISFFARWPSSQTGFQIQSTAGDSGVALLGTRLQSQYVHFTLVYDPIAGTATLYNAGALYGSASGIHIPLNTVATNVGYIGYAVWNDTIGAAIPTTSGNNPFLNANVDELRIYDGALSASAIAATQLLGPNQVLSNVASLGVSYNGGNLILSWPIANGAFTLESTPVLGPTASWLAVSGTKSVVGSNYQLSVPATSAAAFFRLRQ